MKLLAFLGFAALVAYACGLDVNAASRQSLVKTNFVAMHDIDGIYYTVQLSVPPCGSEDTSSKLDFKFYTHGKDEVIIECRNK